MNSAILIILIVSVLGPIIGSLIGVIKKPSHIFMYNMLAFAAGVMLGISFLELIPESINLSSIFVCVLGVILGTFFMFGIDKSIPHIHQDSTQEPGHKLRRTSLYLMLGIFIHNLPEGMAIALGTVSDIRVGISIALGIAVHNIPEGISTAAPYFHNTGKRLKSFLISSATSIPILLGFIIASYLFNHISQTAIGLIVGATAGLMIYITADELIPTSSCKVSDHTTIFSLIFGILFVILLGLI